MGLRNSGIEDPDVIIDNTGDVVIGDDGDRNPPQALPFQRLGIRRVSSICFNRILIDKTCRIWYTHLHGKQQLQERRTSGLPDYLSSSVDTQKAKARSHQQRSKGL